MTCWKRPFFLGLRQTLRRHPRAHAICKMHVPMPDPLRLAALYHAGNGTHWSSYREAAVVLTEKLKIKVGFARIREAVAVSELPTEILTIFSEVGIVNKTARELLKAAKTYGVSSLVDRARTLDPQGKSRAQLS